MLLSELNNLILTAVRSNFLVNEAFAGDVYTINSKENKFGCFVATPMSANKTNSNTITYNYILYYIDRLTKDESNIDLIQTDAVYVLNGIVDWIQHYGVEIGMEHNFTMFRHQFGDWCAGAYLNISFIVPDLTCGEDDFATICGEIIPLSVSTNGVYNPPEGVGYGPVTVNIPGSVTPEWVDNEIDLKLSGYATESWVLSQEYITSSALNGYATQSWVSSKGYLTSVPSEFATKQWVLSNEFATESWVLSKGYLTSVPSEYATKEWVSSNEFATEQWVLSQGYITSETIPEDIATQSWVLSQEYITSAALNGYATESWVSLHGFATESWVLSQGYITSETIPEDIATQSWVLSQKYITSAALNGYATESWVSSKGYLTSIPSEYATKEWVSSQQFAKITYVDSKISDVKTWVSEYLVSNEFATESWVSSQGYLTSVPSEYATESWVLSQGYITSETIPEDIATQSWVLSQEYITSAALNGYATENWVNNYFATQYWVSNTFIDISEIQSYATQSWVLSKSYITSETLSGYATESWVSSQQFATVSYVNSQVSDTKSWVLSQAYITSAALVGYATESWVESQEYLTIVPSEYVTESWISSQQFATISYVDSQISDVESWVLSQSYITSNALTGYATSDWVRSNYATKSWVSSYFFEESKIWTGTVSEWNNLTSAQKALYTIALITE